MPRLPVSIRLTLWYGVWQLGLLILFAFVIGAAAHFDRHMRIHQRLFASQADLMRRMDLTGDVPTARPPLGQLDGVFARADPLALHVRMLDRNGRIVDASPNTVEKSFFVPSPPDENEIVEMDQRVEGQLVRVMYAPVIRGNGTRAGWLEVSAYNLELSRILPARSLLVVLPVFVLISLFGGYFLARRAMRPVARLTDTARRLQPTDLHVRLPRHAGFRDELTDLTDTFNGMLDRLQAAFERERRFTENAAHEMMNPVTALRSEAETTLRRPRSEAVYRASLESILSETVRLGSMLELLLRLARVQSDTTVRGTRTDLAGVVSDSLRDWRMVAADRGIRLEGDFDTPDPAIVIGNRVYLEMIVDNLLDNALKYTGHGGRVDVSIESDRDAWRLIVKDTGCGFEPDESAVLFDRFYRSRRDGTPEVSGSGLGLALVATVVELLGGSVHAESEGVDLGSTFSVVLPAAS